MGGGMQLDEWQAICPVTGRLGGVVDTQRGFEKNSLSDADFCL